MSKRGSKHACKLAPEQQYEEAIKADAIAWQTTCTLRGMYELSAGDPKAPAPATMDAHRAYVQSLVPLSRAASAVGVTWLAAVKDIARAERGLVAVPPLGSDAR